LFVKRGLAVVFAALDAAPARSPLGAGQQGETLAKWSTNNSQNNSNNNKENKSAIWNPKVARGRKVQQVDGPLASTLALPCGLPTVAVRAARLPLVALFVAASCASIAMDGHLALAC